MKGVDELFHLSYLESEHRLSVIYKRMMEKKYDLKILDEKKLAWGPEYFGLENLSLYRKLDDVQKKALLELLNERLFASFLYVETSGLTFGAKMILASETFQEKSLYASFVEEESRHYMEFNRFVNLSLEKEKHWLPMLDVLGSSILEAERETMIYLIHVLLEGFSITHYKLLSEGCKDPELMLTFARILDDEGRHHSMGFTEKGKSITPQVRDQIFEYSRRFLNFMKHSHPVLTAYQMLFAKLSEKELALMNEEAKVEIRGAQRSLVFENLLKRNDYYDLHERLKQDKVL